MSFLKTKPKEKTWQDIISENLKLLRRRHGLTQDAVAEKIGYSRNQYAAWEAGRSVPRLEGLLNLAELYHCTVDNLIRDRSQPKK